jgi:hypothetical protein
MVQVRISEVIWKYNFSLKIMLLTSNALSCIGLHAGCGRATVRAGVGCRITDQRHPTYSITRCVAAGQSTRARASRRL